MLLWVALALLGIASSAATNCITTAGVATPHCFAKADEYLTPNDLRVLELLRTDKVVHSQRAEEGKGQPSTMIMTLASGIKMKCKNGRAAYFKMDGTVTELFAFYLDRLLRGGHVLPVVVSEFSGSRWKDVRAEKDIAKYWKKGDPLVCAQWLDNVQPAVWPPHLKQQSLQLTVARAAAKNWSQAEKDATALWSQVVAFDFVTGNHERLSNSLQAAAAVWRAKKDRKVQGITLAACRKPDCVIDNAFVTGDGKLVLVDNNSAFAYDRNMMDALPWMLDDTCIFPARFVEELRRRDGPAARSELYALVARHEPECPLPNYGRGNMFVAQYQALMRHLKRCEDENGALSPVADDREL